MKVEIKAPRAVDAEELADELRRIANLIEQGFTCGEVHGGWWSLEGDYPKPDVVPDPMEIMSNEARAR